MTTKQEVDLYLPNLKVEDALAFLEEVKSVKVSFDSQLCIYDEFLDIMRKFKSDIIDASGVVHHISILFKDYPHLIIGFNLYLPASHKIELHPYDDTGAVSSNSSFGQKTEKNSHQLDNNSPVYISNGAKLISADETNHELVSDISKSSLIHLPAEAKITVKVEENDELISGSNDICETKQKKADSGSLEVSGLTKQGSVKEFVLFKKIYKALRSKTIYENFIRCIILYNQEIISRKELLILVTPFLRKFPELIKSFEDLLGCNESDSSNIGKMVCQKRTRGTAALAIKTDCASCGCRILAKNNMKQECSEYVNPHKKPKKEKLITDEKECTGKQRRYPTTERDRKRKNSCDIFGTFVASKLHSIDSKYFQDKLKRKIEEIITLELENIRETRSTGRKKIIKWKALSEKQKNKVKTKKN